MRVAIILPTAKESSSSFDGLKKSIPILIDGLKKRGADITIFAPDTTGFSLDTDLRAVECLHLANVFEQADDFDIIHNHYDFMPLAFNDLIAPPMMTTIYEPLSKNDIKVYKRYNSRVFYINDTNSPVAQELDYIATIDHNATDPRKMIDAYIKAYEFVIENESWESRRPWGRYTVLSDTREQKAKLVHVNPGKRLSLQRHKHRYEHWHILRGEARVILNDAEHNLKTGDSINIEPGDIHRIKNTGDDIMTFFEVQTGSYLGEDDIERLEDDYSRTE